jgi:predicted CXXCH cytochrome family protein
MRLWMARAGRALAAPLLLGSIVLGAGILPAGVRAGTPQPVQFNHRVHVQRMTCIFCHRFYETRENAGRPELSRCMLCHSAEVSASPEAQKLRVLAQQHRPLAWVRLTQFAPYVRFSHQRHVAVGKVDCGSCHGAIAQTEAPPPAALIAISMQLCIDCHRSPALQLTAESVQALKSGSLNSRLREALQELEHKRFGSSSEALAAVSQRAGGALSEQDRQAIKAELHPAPAVSTDCFACHR